MEKKKCIHEGHRARLLETVYNVGFDHLSDIQTVEFMLFLVFPRGDVNPLAHRLIDRFGNIANIIDADANELQTIEGIGERSAKLIVSLSKLFDKVCESRAERNKRLLETSEFCDFFEELLRFRTTENLFMVAIDSDFRYMTRKKLTLGSVSSVGVPPIEITNFISSSKARGIIVAHNHPNGNCLPTQADLESTRYFEKVVRDVGVDFIEHAVVGPEGIYGIKRGKLLRKFN